MKQVFLFCFALKRSLGCKFLHFCSKESTFDVKDVKVIKLNATHLTNLWRNACLTSEFRKQKNSDTAKPCKNHKKDEKKTYYLSRHVNNPTNKSFPAHFRLVLVFFCCCCCNASLDTSRNVTFFSHKYFFSFA